MYNNDGSSSSLEPDINPDEQEEKARLISQVLELQNTLDGKTYDFSVNFHIKIDLTPVLFQIYHNESTVLKKKI